MADYLRVFEFACKTARSLIVGKGAPTLPGPLDDGDLLAAAEESRESWEPGDLGDYTPLPRTYEKCSKCGGDYAMRHYCETEVPWWVERAVEAKAAKTETPVPCISLDCIKPYNHSGQHQYSWGDGIPWPPEADDDYDGPVGEFCFGYNQHLPLPETSDVTSATRSSGEDPPRGAEEAPRGADSHTSDLLREAAQKLDWYIGLYETSLTAQLNAGAFTKQLRARADLVAAREAQK